MTDADLARWERMAEGDWMGPEYAPHVVGLLLAEVRRLRATLTHAQLANRGLIARIALLEAAPPGSRQFTESADPRN